MLRGTAEAMRELDEDIVDLEQQSEAISAELMKIKRYRNSFAPLCRMPAEVLELIFGLVQFGRDTRASAPWAAYNAKWIVCTQVCHHLRGVALDTPSLWAFISPRPAFGAWETLCIERAGESMLEVGSPGYVFRYETAGDGMVALRSLPAWALARVRRITYRFVLHEELHAVEAFEGVVNTPLPAVESVWCDLGYEGLPAGFLGGSSSTLTSLTLRSAAFGSFVADSDFGEVKSAPVLPALRHLDIQIRLLDALDQLAALLRDATSLETLIIDGDDTVLSEPMVPEDLQDLTLPHLRSLRITGVASVIHGLMNVISPAPWQDLYIDTLEHAEDTNSYANIYNYLLRFWSNRAPLPAGQIEWRGRRFRGASRCFLTFDSEFAADSAADHPRVFFRYHYPADIMRVPQELIERVEAASFVPLAGSSWDAENWEAEGLCDLQIPIRRVVCHGVAKVRHLPQDFDRWVRQRAAARAPLEHLEFIDCPVGAELVGYGEGLRDHNAVQSLSISRPPARSNFWPL
jgi:hypothetical protein